MIPSKMFQDLRKSYVKDKSLSTGSSSNILKIVPNVCGFRKSGSSSFTGSRNVIPTESGDRYTESSHKICVKDNGSRYISQYMNVQLQKPSEFAVKAFTSEEERYKSLDKTISKTTSFENFIQNLNNDRDAHQDLGCTPIDICIDSPDNGDQVGKC